MNKKQIIGGIVAAVLFIAIGVTSVFTNTLSDAFLKKNSSETLLGGTELQFPNREYVGVVSVIGTIQEQTDSNSVFEVSEGYQHLDTLEYIDRMKEDPLNKGILLRVDSPGGTVYESEELYLKLKEYQQETNRPVWTYMEHYAASGGYYISAPSDKIYANPNTTTGSIGVIISRFDMTGLYEKLGIRSYSITSGKNKDMSQMNDEQTTIYQSIVDESYNRFVEIVADGRKMNEEEVKKLADGRIYSAKQAKANGLIDEIGLYEDMREDMRKEVGENIVFYEPKKETSMLASFFGKLESLKTKSEAEILKETEAELGSGVPMYYAEQLR